MMGVFINCKWFKVYIFYEHSVVGGNTYFSYIKMGARTHSAWRYNAFAKQCNCGNLSAWVKFECYIWGDILFTQRCWCKHIFFIHKNGREDSQNLPLQRVHGYLQLYIQNNLCINTYTPQVAATSFFIHRTEIYDFVVR